MDSQYSLIEISYLDLAIGFTLLMITAGFSRLQKLEVERELLIASIRTFLQLIAVGFILKYVMGSDNPYLITILVLIMLSVAVITVTGRQRIRSPELSYIVGFAMLAGTGLSVIVLTQVLIEIKPWYQPYYLIPIAGMIIGNSMNGATLAVERIDSELRSKRDQIEALLALGATSNQAGKDCIRAAIKASLIPTINTMMVVGIVSLPGMMTGQILSGISPFTAVKYQIIIMYMIALSVAVTSYILTHMRFKKYFTPAHQLKNDAF